jgi:ABC-type nitrate/sulfonate/bicarbonate transport system substrate-binding protein
VNQASASDAGQMWGGAYIVSPAGIMVPQDSDIRHPRDLAGREIAVGFHSGSHFTTVQALEPFLTADEITLKFVGPPWDRVDAGLAGEVAATSVWGITYLAAEQLGLRKVLDCTFMMAFMFPPEAHTADIAKYMNALKRAQMEIDLFPERYKDLYRDQIPERYRDAMDVRLFGAGERIVFLPYTRETFDRTQAWIRERGLFETRPDYDFDRAVCSEDA